ncbi:uncharacterized protein K02A2.6-like [Macrosteles quadrilineatus]|uniref:uncharacterized protein K02A2.6-like n=1 Tax=Macrosteles quadrilineatus TaxID=74068 RepID=UPI0023E121C2|nr:uncharacterized protein K02A2.6-like [Macrosteles quadrilineatus]
MKIEGKTVPMELDTGAALSTMSYKDFKKLSIPQKVFSTNVALRTYTGETIKPRGVTFVNCMYKTQRFVGKLFLIEQNVDAIFGRDWLREVKLDWGEIKSLEMNQTSSLGNMLSDFSDVFDGKIGVIPDHLGQLRVMDDAKPIFVKPRQVPYSLRSEIEKELKRLEECGIITKVDHSDWGTPIVPVVKPNGQVRICADYKVTVNKLIKDENYPIPRIEDIYTQMNGGKIFCTLDISNAYLHMRMDEESAHMQTLSTPKGMYKVNRLMFGVKVAPSLWQQFMDKTLQGIPGVQCFFDDIIIQGKTEEELLTRLRTVLERMRSKNLRLNRDKCKFFQTSIQYLGHTIDAQGLHKTKEKISAIMNSKQPENVNELRKFLGLANYYNKFIKSLATILYPLNELLRNGKNQLDSFLVDSQIISRKTAEDKFLQSVLRALQTGESVEHLGFHDNELTLQDGCIFKGNRVIIPEVLHHAVLQELHVGHLEWCIRKLRKTFATFGLPLVLVSDNGSQFTSSTFRQFLSANGYGVVHKTTAPYHPSSNGQAERYVQTIKKSLKAMEEEGDNSKWGTVYRLETNQVLNGNGALELPLEEKVPSYTKSKWKTELCGGGISISF